MGAEFDSGVSGCVWEWRGQSWCEDFVYRAIAHLREKGSIESFFCIASRRVAPTRSVWRAGRGQRCYFDRWRAALHDPATQSLGLSAGASKCGSAVCSHGVRLSKHTGLVYFYSIEGKILHELLASFMEVGQCRAHRWNDRDAECPRSTVATQSSRLAARGRIPVSPPWR